VLPGCIPHRAVAAILAEGPALSVVHAADLTAVLWPAVARRSLLRALSRTAVVERLRLRQVLLERLLDIAQVLPALPGATMTGEEAARMLRCNAALVRQAAQTLGARMQYQVTVSWSPAAALARFRDAPELAPAGRGDPAGAALRTAEGAERLRMRLGAAFRADLAAATEDHLGLPCVGPETLVNTAVLLSRSGVPALESALERIDAVWTDGLSIRMVGPLPPVSFASLRIERIPCARLRTAAAALGLDDPAQDPEPAFRRAVLRLHPDVSGGLDVAGISALQDARRLLVWARALGPEETGTGGSLLRAALWRDDRAGHADQSAETPAQTEDAA
jgi:hypothetical protein